MKKIKLVMMSAALLLSIGGAVATRAANFDCTNVQNYYYNGAGYVATGVFGRDYICVDGGTACTFWNPGSGYTMCRTGSYFPVNGFKADEAKQVKK